MIFSKIASIIEKQSILKVIIYLKEKIILFYILRGYVNEKND